MRTDPAANESSKKLKVESEHAFIRSSQRAGKDRVTRIIVERFYLTTFWGRSFEKLIGILAAVTSIAFVLLSYNENDNPRWFEIINTVVMSVLGFDLLIRFYISNHKFSFLTSRSCIVDIIVILPVFLVDGGNTYEFFVSTSYLLRSVIGGRILVKSFKGADTEVSRQIFTILITLSLLVYIAAGMIMVAENFARTEDEELRFHQAIYFVIVTLATVGYGEIYPDTELGKIFVI